MHKIKEYMHKIVDNGKVEDMYAIEEYFYKLMCKVHMTDSEMTSYIKSELKELAYGKTIDEECAKEWVYSMKDHGQHWSMEETTSAMESMGYNCDKIDFYVTANMIYNDYYNVVKDNEELALTMAHDWLSDDDAVENKLYEYHKHIVKRD